MSQVLLEETENLLCLSPSRLILAFGVILFILLLALIFACMLWWRARHAGTRHGGHSRLRPKAHPPPHPPHLPPPAMIARAPHPPPPPGPPVGPARRGPAFFIRGRMPYIRVVH